MPRKQKTLCGMVDLFSAYNFFGLFRFTVLKVNLHLGSDGGVRAKDFGSVHVLGCKWHGVSSILQTDLEPVRILKVDRIEGKWWHCRWNSSGTISSYGVLSE